MSDIIRFSSRRQRLDHAFLGAKLKGCKVLQTNRRLFSELDFRVGG